MKIFTIEHKLHLAESIRIGFKNGRVVWNKGKKMPEISGDKNPSKRFDVRKKISEALKGRVYSKEALRNIQRATKDPERNRKISESLKGMNFTGKHIQNIKKSAKESYKKGRVVWNKGLTKETDARIARSAKRLKKTRRSMTKKELGIDKISKTRKQEYIAPWNKNLTKETDERVAKYAKSLVGHKPFYPKSYYVKELGHKVRSPWEGEIGLMLKINRIPYIGYEAITYKFNGTSYTPDYPITEKVVVEVKGPLYDQQRKKYKEFMKNYPNITFILVGSGDESICDIHIPWKDRNELVDVVRREIR